MKVTIRPWRLPDDFPRIAALATSATNEPVTVEALEHDEQAMPEDAILHRVAAVGEDGAMVGYGYAERVPSLFPAGEWSVRVVVDPALRGKGIGRTLAAEVERYALAAGATRFRTTVRDNDADARAFAERRGYALDYHLFESTLDLRTFDQTRFAGAVERVREGGIRFFTLADEPGEGTERKIYEFVKRNAWDIPNWDLAAFPTFEQWRRWDLGNPGFRPDCCIIAADGDQIVGLTAGMLMKDSGALYTDFTGVDRAYRGRGIALALKLLAVEAARRHGAPYMRTNNDSRNAPMLAVNRKLGYVPAPGLYRFKKHL